MKGRTEHDIKNNKLALSLIQDAPFYMKDYYNSFDGSSTSITRLNYIRSVNQFLDYLSENNIIDRRDIATFTNIKPANISTFLASLRVNGKEIKTSSKAAKYYGICNFMKFLNYNDYIDKNPCDKVKPPKITDAPPVVAMNKEEISVLKNNAESCSALDAAIVSLGCTTGLRVSSITEINLEDISKVNDDLWVITVIEKGNKQRNVMISTKTIGAINKWLEVRKNIRGSNNTNALFINRTGKRISQRFVQKFVHRCSNGIDKHITPHKMRSTCATNLYNATGDIYLVQNVLGHSNISNTRRYTSVDISKSIEATKVLNDLI